MPPPGGVVPGSTTAWFWVTERPGSAERSSHTDQPDARRVAADLFRVSNRTTVVAVEGV